MLQAPIVLFYTDRNGRKVCDISLKYAEKCMWADNIATHVKSYCFRNFKIATQ
jgi:hypothetical protein